LLKYFLTIPLLFAVNAEAGLLKKWFAKNCEYFLDPRLEEERLMQFAGLDARLRNTRFIWSKIDSVAGTMAFFPTAKIAGQLPDSKPKFVGDIQMRVINAKLHFYQISEGKSIELPFFSMEKSPYLIKRLRIGDISTRTTFADVVKFLGPSDVEFYIYFYRWPPAVLVQTKISDVGTETLFTLDTLAPDGSKDQ
jgi:hypothetical protein